MVTEPIAAQERRRRAESWRLPLLECGHSDPLCLCGWPELTLDSYEAAAQHLLDHDLTPHPDLPAMRAMWRRGGSSQRLAHRIAQRCEVIAC
jgi:hypothetical protein